jgi:hypothetical protein
MKKMEHVKLWEQFKDENGLVPGSEETPMVESELAYILIDNNSKGFYILKAKDELSAIKKLDILMGGDGNPTHPMDPSIQLQTMEEMVHALDGNITIKQIDPSKTTDIINGPSGLFKI